MDLPDPKDFLTLPIAAYLGGVVLAQVGLALYRRYRANQVAASRRQVGLDNQILVDHAVKLESLRNQAVFDAAVLLFTVIGLPFILIQIPSADKNALGVTFITLLLWVLVTATDVAKAFLGGIAFRAFVGFRQPFQIGDRVTLQGHSGKVEEIGPFFLRLTTPNDDSVSIPTSSLWNTPLVSANAGDRASLCVMQFHLAPFVTAERRKIAEVAIWDGIQRSVYWDFDKPMQIYVEQHKDEIILTAKAYVASTYNEPLFRSDVYQAFLDIADAKSIPLASTEWRRSVEAG